ncbi:thioredoxin family protein [Pediococcus argentinicus]|uniref:Thiol-disulfide isomerase and thioredoxin n=1 Tax=Pediococcus argentinicus TaxID=480391 RepID=A0A0R2NN20_9LACO|nr:thioredoxin family protein [Pediococcus argentinicus]KRO26075.1 thiol-disulfide isomerase and thioredoxin [Pediococcus argentinicus]NKZ21737.1 thioredoxin family protein [Pediococcus argentinicus]GEP18900.1 thiol reductase thioredoxin [Pediococcus argentinicus]
MSPQEGLSNEAIFDAIKSGNKMLFFTAGWCPDCSFIKPAMPGIMEKYDEFDWITVDRDANLEVAQEFGIMGIPSFIAFKDGEEIARFGRGERHTPKEVEEFVQSVA